MQNSTVGLEDLRINHTHTSKIKLFLGSLAKLTLY